MQRRPLLALAALAVSPLARAHHGWSSFDQERPIYLEGKVLKVAWRNPHAEVELELAPALKVPADLARRAVPAQTSPVDGTRLLAAATVPTRADKVWELEFAPLTRMEAWKVPETKVGDALAVVGFTSPGEKGDPVLRVEYLFAGGKVYGLRSSPA